MLGYITRREAIKEGYQFSGSYFSLPIWIMVEEEAPESPIVTFKWTPLNCLWWLLGTIEVQLSVFFHPEEEPMFYMLVKEQIQ